MLKREIKFRAYCDVSDLGENETKMLYFTEGKYDNGLWFENTSDHINEYLSPLMQYTGLKDKNGVEIYEGDIISIHSPYIDKSLPWKPATTKFVGWHKDGFWNLFKKDQTDYVGFRGILQSNLQYYTVIGNIHENPELLHQPKVN